MVMIMVKDVFDELCSSTLCGFQGDLLPPPLSYTGEVLDALTPYEVYLLLLNLWKYMKVRTR
jgi:hypothetical protein